MSGNQQPRWLLLHNPVSNHGRSREAVAATIPILRRVADVETYATAAQGDAMRVVSETGDNYDAVIAMGGDGTVSEVVNGLMRLPPSARPRLGVIANGSGNDFAFAAGMPAEAVAAAEHITRAVPRRIDVGAISAEAFETRYFANSVGMFMVAVIGIRAAEIRRVHGLLMYLIATVQTLAKDYAAAPIRLCVDGQESQHEVVMLTFGNGPREGGGFLTNPPADIADGVLNYTFSYAIPRLRMLSLLPAIMRGTHGNQPNVRMGTGCSIRLDSEVAVPIHVDGEIWARSEDNLRSFEVCIQPGALELLA